jgi:hypothetical protein
LVTFPLGLFLLGLPLPPPLLFLESEGGLARGLSSMRREAGFSFLAGAFSGFRLALPARKLLGSSAPSLKRPFVPTGRRRTTPGLAIVSATICGSSDSLAKP